MFALVPFEPTGVPASFAPTAKDTRVHAGFLIAHNSVAQSVVNAVSAQVRANPTYSIVTTGHSLGAALASLFAVTLKANFPNTTMKVYTFGQPRTGDRSYADLIDRLVGQQNIYRAVHTTGTSSDLEDPSTIANTIYSRSGNVYPTAGTRLPPPVSAFS